MAIDSSDYKPKAFKEIVWPDDAKYRVKFAGPLEPGDQEIVMKADIAIEDLSKDIVYPVVRYPQDAPKGPPKYDLHFTLKVHGIPSIKSYLDAALSELRALRSSMGYVSGKEVRRLISKIKRACKPILCRLPSERVLIELLTQFMDRKNPNKIARMIRRAVARKARAELQATRPLLAIKPDFAELRSVDGKDLDSAFRGQDES